MKIHREWLPLVKVRKLKNKKVYLARVILIVFATKDDQHLASSAISNEVFADEESAYNFAKEMIVTFKRDKYLSNSLGHNSVYYKLK